MQALLYLIMILAALLPVVFRHSLSLRIGAVVTLWIVGVGMVWSHCVALHRLVMLRGVEILHLQVGAQLPADFQTTTRIVQDLSQSQLPFTLLVFVAFTTLALVPTSSTAHREPRKRPDKCAPTD